MVTTENQNNQHQPSRLRPAMDAINSILSANGHEEALSLTVQSVCDVLGQGASAAITLTDSQERLDTHSHFVAGPLSSLLTREAPRTDGVTVRVVQSCQPIIEPDVQKYESAEHPQIRTKLGSVGAFSCLPLAHNEHVYGALFVVFEEPFVFDEDAIVCLESMASLATRSIEMTEQLRTIEAQTMLQADTYRQFSAQLRSTWETVHTTASIEQTLDEILRRVDEEVIVEADISASIYVYNEEDDRFKSGAARGPLKDYMVNIPPRKRGTARHALETGEPLFVNDVTKAPTYVPQLHDEAKRYDIKAYANIPLVMGEGESKNTIGILIINLQQEFEFTDSIQSVLRVFSDQAAITLQSARVYRRRIREQQAVHEVSESAASGELRQVGLAVTRKAVELSHSDYATLWSVERTANEINLVGHYTVREDWDLPGDRLPIDDNSMNGHTVLKGEAYYQTDLKKGDPHYASWHPEIKSAFCVPLRAGGELVGTLYVANLHQEISESHREFIQRLAVTAAIALRTAAHQATLRKVLAFQQAISDVKPVEDQIEEIHKELAKYIDVTHLFLARYNPETNEIKLDIVYKKGNLDDEATYAREFKPKTGGEFTDFVIRHDQSLLVPNIENWQHRDEIEDEFSEGVKSAVAVPMRLGKQIVGVLGMRNYERAYVYGREHLTLLEPIANHIAVVMENAERFQQQIDRVQQQYDRIQQQNDRIQEQIARREAISEFQERISDIETEESEYKDIYTAAYKVLTERKLLDTRNMYIALWDKITDKISFPLAYHDGEPVPDEAKEPDNWDWDPEKQQWIPKNPEWNLEWVAYITRACRKTEIGLTEWVIKNRKPLLIEENFEENFEEKCKALGIKAFAIGTKSWLGAPMIVEGDVIGVIGLQIFEDEGEAEVKAEAAETDEVEGETKVTNEGVFEEKHKQLLSTIAGQAAVAIANARKYDTVQKERRRRQTELKAIAEFQQRISHLETATSGYHDIYNAAHEVLSRRGLLDTRNMYIALWDKTTDMISFPLAYQHKDKKKDKIGEVWKTRLHRKSGIGLTEWVIDNRSPLLIEQNFKEQCENLGISIIFDMGTKSWLGAPMIVEGNVIGIIGLQNFEQEGVFEDRHKQLLLTIAGQAALAIQQERISQEREKRQQSFREISERMATASQEPGVALELVARTANELYDADLTSVFRYDSIQNEFESGVRIQADGLTEVVSARDLPNSGDMITRVAGEQKVEYYPGKEQSTGETLSGYAEEQGVVSYVSLPLVVGTQTVGVMVINFTSKRGFSRQDDETLRHLATQAALAIGFDTAIEAMLANEQWEALGQATAALQHRINSTIALSIPVIMRLQYRYGDDPETVDMLETIERNTRYALQIFKRLKRVLGSGDRFDKASINILLRSAIKECVASGFEPPVHFTVQSSDDSISIIQSTPENTHDPVAIDITFEPDSNVPLTSLRAEAMQEVLHIVVENAIKSIVKMESVDNGQIHISSRFLDENSQPDNVRGAIEITVTDNGGGIPEEKLERLVTEIVPRRDFMEGAGMGLWLSGIILRNHKGKITPHSDGEGKGATFTIRLPVLPSPPVHSPLLFNQEHDNNENGSSGS